MPLVTSQWPAGSVHLGRIKIPINITIPELVSALTVWSFLSARQTSKLVDDLRGHEGRSCDASDILCPCPRVPAR
eukprot:1143998-Pelagomonas_calceolata.AAC.2